MGPKKGKRVRKIKVPTDSVLRWGTLADIQQRREEREARERKEKAQKQMEESRKEETTHSAEEGVSESVQRQTKVTWIHG